MILAVVVLGHAGLLVLLVRAMAPWQPALVADRPLEVVSWIEFEPQPSRSDPPAEPEPAESLPPREVRAPVVRRPVRSQAPAPAMEAVFVEAPVEPSPEAATGRIAEHEDPFFSPPDAAPAQGFGRRDQAALPQVRRPRVPGARPPGSALPELRAQAPLGVRSVVEIVGGLIGGGPNAPVEAPCAGRIGGEVSVAGGASPAWQGRYGCSDTRDGYDGRVSLPPGHPDARR
ncbi:MAG: hypothetical protein KF823_03115 [Xanthomonadales bacterium]|nr:hypothetical protein [Xanthomonadales bacterium]